MDPTDYTNLMESVEWGQYLPPIISGIFAFYILRYVQNLVKRIQALSNLLSSPYVCIGSWLSLPTSTGSSAGRIIKADKRRITLKHREATRYIDILNFESMDVVVLDRPPVWARNSAEYEDPEISSIEEPEPDVPQSPPEAHGEKEESS